MKRKITAILLVVALALALVVPAASVGASPGPGIVGLWHLDDESDPTADDSGNDLDGTVYGATYVADQWGGKALNFNGSTDYVEVSDDDDLDITTDLTIEAWVKLDTRSSLMYVVAKDKSGDRNYGLYVDGRLGPTTCVAGLIVFNSAGSNSQMRGSTILNTGQWYHLAGTYHYVAPGTSEMKIYVDGSLDAAAVFTAVGPIKSGSANLQIGARERVGERQFFDGLIDEVRIWDTATPSFNIDAEPDIDFNPIFADHEVTATVTIDKVGADVGTTESAPGVKVSFEVSGQNDDTGVRYTNSSGVANLVPPSTTADPFNYTGDGGAGSDTIDVSIDWDWSAGDSDAVTKDWVTLVSLTPSEAFNPVNTEHEVEATISSAVDGVTVWFDVDGANTASGSEETDDGVATFSYTGTIAGLDTITAYFDTDGEGDYDEGEPMLQVEKYYLENFVTGGGKLNMSTLGLNGNKVAGTFAGTVGVLEGEGIVGQFQIVDHTGKKAEAWHCNNDFSYLNFGGPPTGSPPASHSIAVFTGKFTSNRGSDDWTVTIIIADLGEPGAGVDKIKFGGLPPYLIDGGNFQVHNIIEPSP